jgi:hypothetical protein
MSGSGMAPSVALNEDDDDVDGDALEVDEAPNPPGASVDAAAGKKRKTRCERH